MLTNQTQSLPRAIYVPLKSESIGAIAMGGTMKVPMHLFVSVQTFVSRTRLAVQRAEDMTATPFEEDNISVVPSDQGQAPGGHVCLNFSPAYAALLLKLIHAITQYRPCSTVSSDTANLLVQALPSIRYAARCLLSRNIIAQLSCKI